MFDADETSEAADAAEEYGAGAAGEVSAAELYGEGAAGELSAAEVYGDAAAGEVSIAELVDAEETSEAADTGELYGAGTTGTVAWAVEVVSTG